MGPRFEKIVCSAMDPLEAKPRFCHLQQMLVNRLPESLHMFTLCRIGMQQRFPQSCHAQFYMYLDDDCNDEKNWQKDKDPFIVCIERFNLHAKKGIILHAPKTITSVMMEALDLFIGWDEPQVFQTVPQLLWDYLEGLCKSHKNMNEKDNEGIPGILLAIWDLDKAKELNLDCEPSVELRELEEKDVPEMVRNWKWAVDHSEKGIRESVKTLVSAGAFVDGEMASSVVLSPLGSINILYTPEKYRRRGFAQLVIKSVSRKASRDLGINPLGEVEAWNDASKSLLEKSIMSTSIVE